MELMECLVSNRATLLALHGFAAYALPYFSFGDLPRGCMKWKIVSRTDHNEGEKMTLIDVI